MAETLRRIPVIVLSSSTREENISRACDLHANCYIAKPADLEKLLEVVKAIDRFWLGIVARARPSAPLDQGSTRWRLAR